MGWGITTNVITTQEQALIACVKALGGTMRVGIMIWPDVCAPVARGRLLNCIIPRRKPEFSPEQLIKLLRLAQHAGFHGGFEYFAREAGYSIRPLDSTDSKAVSNMLTGVAA